MSVDCPEHAAVLQCASEVVKEGRREQRMQEMRTELVRQLQEGRREQRMQEMRTELVRQLQEAEATEVKENVKVGGALWYELPQ